MSPGEHGRIDWRCLCVDDQVEPGGDEEGSLVQLEASFFKDGPRAVADVVLAVDHAAELAAERGVAVKPFACTKGESLFHISIYISELCNQIVQIRIVYANAYVCFLQI